MGRFAFNADHRDLPEHFNVTTEDFHRRWKVLGMVMGLRLRSPGSTNPTIVTVLDAVAGMGLSGDSHASALSPRQVLLADSHVYSELGLPVQTLRENFLVDFATDRMSGSALLVIGEAVILRTTFQCEPCGRLEGHHPGVLQHIGARRGILARVIRGGRVRVGDSVRCCLLKSKPLADDWKERILQVLEQVPKGQQIEYRHLAKLAGVPKVYCRVFPKILAKAPVEFADRARPGDVEVSRQWLGQEFHRLKDEAALRELAQ